MGKLVGLILILVIVDLLFLTTGQLTLDSPSSIIISAIQNPERIKDVSFWAILVTGIGALGIVAGVVAGFVTKQADIFYFVTMGSSLALLIGDYIAIFIYLNAINSVVATLIMSPIIIVFTLVIVEWLRGKD